MECVHLGMVFRWNNHFFLVQRGANRLDNGLIDFIHGTAPFLCTDDMPRGKYGIGLF